MGRASTCYERRFLPTAVYRLVYSAHPSPPASYPSEEGLGETKVKGVHAGGAAPCAAPRARPGSSSLAIEAGDVEFEDVDAEIDVSPESSLDSEQGVDQSATASR